MATTDEILLAAEEEEESVDNTLVIDWDTREIAIPSTITLIGVENDKDSNRLYFKCPATYGEFNIADYSLRVSFGNYNSSKNEQSADIYIVNDAESDGEYITFSWLVGENAYTTQGYVNFIICCKYIDSEGNVVSDLNTTLASLDVLEGRNCNIDEVAKENYSDLYDTLVALWQTLSETITEANTASDKANEAAEAANTASDKANEAAEAANTASDKANEAAELVAAQMTFLLEVNSNGSLTLIYSGDDESE